MEAVPGPAARLMVADGRVEVAQDLLLLSPIEMVAKATRAMAGQCRESTIDRREQSTLVSHGRASALRATFEFRRKAQHECFRILPGQ